MDTVVGVLVGGLLALLGSVVTQWFTQQHQSQLAREERRQTSLARQQTYLVSLMERLLHASIGYHAWMADRRGVDVDTYVLAQRQSELIGEAIAACIASGDDELKRIGLNENGKGFVLEIGQDAPSQNQDALQNAVERLSRLIKQTVDLQEENKVK